MNQEEFKRQRARALAHRQQAYHKVFDEKNIFTRTVLKDLARFCRGNRTCFDPDPRLHACLEGRREVFLRILKHLKMDPVTFLQTYGVDKGDLA